MSWSREAGSPAFLDQEQHGLLGLSPALLPRERVGCTVPRKQEAVPLPSEHSCNGGLCSWSVPRPLCRFCGQGLGAPLLAPSQPSVSLRVSASRGRLPPLHPQHPLRERAGGPQVLVAACESHPCLPQLALHASVRRLAPFTAALPLVLVAACESHQDPRPPRRASLGTAGAHRHPCLPQLALHASLRRLAPFTPALPLALPVSSLARTLMGAGPCSRLLQPLLQQRQLQKTQVREALLHADRAFHLLPGRATCQTFTWVDGGWGTLAPVTPGCSPPLPSPQSAHASLAYVPWGPCASSVAWNTPPSRAPSLLPAFSWATAPLPSHVAYFPFPGAFPFLGTTHLLHVLILFTELTPAPECELRQARTCVSLAPCRLPQCRDLGMVGGQCSRDLGGGRGRGFMQPGSQLGFFESLLRYSAS